MDARGGRQAMNEALMREVNERLAGLDRNAIASWANAGELFEFVCECSRFSCDEHLRMTLEEYDEVRGQDDRFAIVPGHETATIERVVRSTDRFAIVDKADAVEGYVADDPRGAPSK